MSKKRIEQKPVIKTELKKRETVDSNQMKVQLEPLESTVFHLINKPKKSENKYVKLALNASQDDRRYFGERVQKNEITFAYYTIEDNIGYTYYIINK